MKQSSLICASAVAGLVACLAAPSAKADENDRKTVVTFNTQTEVPGIVLAPGTYVIRLLNSSSNRHIAEIMNEKMDHLYALTFTVSAERLTPTSKPVLTFYEGANGQPQAIRRWFWPSYTFGEEFIYPKDQAAKISARTNEKVPEGNLPTVAESGQSLTPDNAKPPVLESTKAEPNPEPKTESRSNASVATNSLPGPAPAPSTSTSITPATTAQVDRTPQPVQVAQATPPPAAPVTAPLETVPNTSTASDSSDKSLPHTASQLPLFAAIGIASLLGASLLSFLRRRATN